MAGFVLVIDSGRGTTRAEDAQGIPTQSHVSPSILVYEDKSPFAPNWREMLVGVGIGD